MLLSGCVKFLPERIGGRAEGAGLVGAIGTCDPIPWDIPVENPNGISCCKGASAG